MSGTTLEYEDLKIEDYEKLFENSEISFNIKSFKSTLDAFIKLAEYENQNKDFDLEYQDLKVSIKNFKEKFKEVPLSVMDELSEIGFKYNSSNNCLEKTFDEEDRQLVILMQMVNVGGKSVFKQ